MARYTVEVVRTLVAQLEVEADNEFAAYRKVRDGEAVQLALPSSDEWDELDPEIGVYTPDCDEELYRR